MLWTFTNVLRRRWHRRTADDARYREAVAKAAAAHYRATYGEIVKPSTVDAWAVRYTAGDTPESAQIND